MEEKQIKEALKKLRETPKRKFKQKIDIIINLKQLDLKKVEQQVDLFLTLPKATGKKAKVCALVGPELYDQAKSVCDSAVRSDEFETYGKNKRMTQKLSNAHSFFIAQATIMPKVASAFGRVLGVRGKMPNPKAGCVVPPNANLKPLYDRLQNTVRLIAKKSLVVQALVGVEDSTDEDLIENLKYIYNNLLHALPQDKNNIKSIYIKYTMGKPIRIV
jgi:large subunit ribosomal protein L1